jgi:hypothetical protein
MRRLAVGSLIGTILILGVWKVIPYLRQPGPATDSTPTFQPLRDYTTIALKESQELCINRVTLTPKSRYAQFTIAGQEYGTPPVTVVASAAGYKSIARLPAGPRSALLTVALTPPVDELSNGKVCVLNQGTEQLHVIAASEGKSTTLSTTSIDSKPAKLDVPLTLLSSLSATRLDRLSSTISHAAAFVPLAPWTIWVLLFLLLVGVPLALVVALSRSIYPGSSSRSSLDQP